MSGLYFPHFSLTGSFRSIENITFSPVGYVRSPLKARYETPHQGVLEQEHESFIELLPHKNFEQAITELAGFERIWVIYQFHLNDSWKPMVTPPKNKGKKVGVFASRSPHRPNHIGLSCVKLVKTEGLKVYISGSDILDGSPVFDIKPYLPYSDSFPDSATGWVEAKQSKQYRVIFDAEAENTALRIKDTTGHDLMNYARVQLATEPDNTERKRITLSEPSEDVRTGYRLKYREWNAEYYIDEEDVIVLRITGG